MTTQLQLINIIIISYYYISTSLARLYGVHRNNFIYSIDVYQYEMRHAVDRYYKQKMLAFGMTHFCYCLSD